MVRFGLVGTNWITERFIEAAKEVESFSLTAVYSRTENRAKEFAEKVGAPLTFTNLEAMASSGEIDAVYIASPNSFHAQQAITFMNHGIHVLCEKPAASNTSEVKSMIEAAKRNGVVFMEALKTTLLPNFRVIQENLYKIGKVRRYVASYCQYSSRYDAYKEGTILNAFNPSFSNGSLMDIGIYGVYPLVVLFGRPKQIKANGFVLESGVDGQGSLIVDYGDKEAIVTHSKVSNSYIPSEIQGEEGSIVIDHIHTPQQVVVHYRDGRVEDLTQPQKVQSMYYEAAEFISLIENKQLESNVNSHDHSLAVAEILEEARRQIGLIYPADTFS
ncbi:MAG TPA: Gfo/Idh/MocA family oxidoreductase [Chondromyces sp.]|nr:Gfo/Idh/MocA family oxidoreductase [Chondromyces sp.]